MESVGGYVYPNKIEVECKEIGELLTAAKFGKWDVVWNIIGTPQQPKKEYLLNSIPENRRWGVLHQAIWWKDPNILRTILQFRACDKRMKAKECTSEVGETSGLTALEIAEAYKYSEMVIVLNQQRCWFTEGDDGIDTFLPANVEIQGKGRGLIAITLAAYKNTFHPKPIDRTRSIQSILETIFNEMNTTADRWKSIKDKVKDSLYAVNPTSSKNIKDTSRDEFYKSVITVYTEESTYLYTHVNTALRRQKDSNYRPSAKDLAIGPYVLMYQILLLFWTNLKRDSKTTYRKMLLSRADRDRYKVGETFSWVSFVSSSVDLSKAVPFPTCEIDIDDSDEFNIIFTINNTKASAWQPRDIESYARYHERERVYPAGAKFVITGRTERNGETNVAMSLVS